jgi:cellulose synthase/poly-beta-1,6-N-acetylglucosamine synthase-like glycosyltransferase
VTPTISVIVPAYNAEATLGRCLNGLSNQTVSQDHYEVIVVDDGSEDDTRARARCCPEARLYTQAHAGPAAARNHGVRQAHGDILLFTDADCEPTPTWIEQMIAPFTPSATSKQREAVVSWSKGAYVSRQRALVARFVQLEYEERYERLARQETIDFIDTYSAAYRREAFQDSGGFDESFPEASVEDQELSFRLAQRGFRMVFVPKARVAHWGHPETVRAYWRRKFKIGFWKVRVLQLHPGKLWRDSHTPQGLKAQIVLLTLGGFCLAGGFFWPPLAWGILPALGLFLGIAAPFFVRACRTDPAVALASPFLLVVRALALGLGLSAGLVENLRCRLNRVTKAGGQA